MSWFGWDVVRFIDHAERQARTIPAVSLLGRPRVGGKMRSKSRARLARASRRANR